jgi:hypothetical protein
VRRHGVIAHGWPGYGLFLLALIFTAAGSSFYHLAPDNARLVWDRLPIALACAGLGAGVGAETQPGLAGRRWTVALAVAAVLSVLWWYVTEDIGPVGDLRAYLFIQGLPLLLIPLWQTIYRAPRLDRLTFGIAILLYALAKVAEVYDRDLFAMTAWISGHTIKHLLATVAAAVVVGRLIGRVSESTRKEAASVQIAQRA